MVMGLAIQTVMAPLNLWENALVRAVLQKKLSPEHRVFEEKSLAELTPEDEVVNDQGNPVDRLQAAGGGTKKPATKKNLEEVLLDTWDCGAKADLTELMSMLTKDNINTTVTSQDHWTPLMVLAGLNCPNSTTALQTALDTLGAKADITDNDGWTAMHWAAFHGSASAAELLLHATKGVLLSVKDKEGKTPIDLARDEKNDVIVTMLERYNSNKENKKSK
jgi:ankyrin repeat protein